jgi:hypothetical protein
MTRALVDFDHPDLAWLWPVEYLAEDHHQAVYRDT